MKEALVLGTVRGRSGRRHAVALQDGSVLKVVFEGDILPRIGADVIGIISGEGDEIRMELVPDLAKRLLKGKRVQIKTFGRPDLTARMLAHLLDGTGPAVIRPGVGGIIERTPDVRDPDLRWALSQLEPEARRLGIALNVIDPLALAAAPWADRGLVDGILPADSTGERGALSDLKALMADAFQPACRRTLVAMGRGLKVPSVDFVIPYSPFLTGSGFCARIGGAWKSEYAFPGMRSQDARRLSSFREISLAFAARHLGRIAGGEEVARQVEESFADAAAVIAFLRAGGDPSSALRFAQYREAGAARWNGEGDCPPLSWLAIRTAVATAGAMEIADTEALLSQAASLAMAHAPRSEEAMSRLKASATDRDAFVDLDRTAFRTRDVLERHYRSEVAELVARLASSPAAIERLSRFAVMTVPSGFEDAFAEMIEPARSLVDLGADEIRPLAFLDDDREPSLDEVSLPTP
ncbi:hypothetical protein BSY19_5023 (plasmid) [Bosea sp. RAC05]|nr:hypothetical protein BSY19_5023 [Bosea sp. RAC05]